MSAFTSAGAVIQSLFLILNGDSLLSSSGLCCMTSILLFR